MGRRRSNRRKREYVPLNVARIRGADRRTETRRGREYTVSEVLPERAQKTYVCPGCNGEIAIGVAHVVVWRADSIWGDDAAIAERRHWHRRCWEVD